jgi:hypothetical protein
MNEMYIPLQVLSAAPKKNPLNLFAKYCSVVEYGGTLPLSKVLFAPLKLLTDIKDTKIQ